MNPIWGLRASCGVKNTTNINTPRKLDKICIQPLYHKQVVHECINLHTGHVVTRYNVNDAPVTEIFIKDVEVMESEQAIKTLKYKGIKHFRCNFLIGFQDWKYDENDEKN